MVGDFDVRRPLRVLLHIVMLLASQVPSTAAADDDDPRKVQAEPHLREGKRLFDQGRYEEALGKLKLTYEVFPSPNVLTLIAVVEQKLGRSLEAIGHFRAALRNSIIHPENAEIAKKGITELEQHLARVDVLGPRGLIVTIGRNEHSLPLKEPLDVTPGTIIGEGKLAETTYRGRVIAEAGKRMVLDMMPDAPSPPPTEPPRGSEMNELRWGTGRYLGLGLFGVGLAGLATGAGFAVAKSSANEEVERLEQFTGPNGDRCGQSPPPRACGDVQGARDDRDSYGAVSTAFFIGGGAVLVGGAVVFFVTPHKKIAPASGVIVTPRISPRSVGVELRF